MIFSIGNTIFFRRGWLLHILWYKEDVEAHTWATINKKYYAYWIMKSHYTKEQAKYYCKQWLLGVGFGEKKESISR